MIRITIKIIIKITIKIMIRITIKIMIRKVREGSAPDVICNQTLPQHLPSVAFYQSMKMCSAVFTLMNVGCWSFHASSNFYPLSKVIPPLLTQCNADTQLSGKQSWRKCCRNRFSESHHIFQNTLELPSTKTNICCKSSK